MGTKGPEADAEVIALAIEAMLQSGLDNFQISLGQVQFIHGLMVESDITPLEQQLIKQCMLKRDLVGLSEVLAASRLSTAAQATLQQIPLLHGKADMLQKAYGLTENETSKLALDNLAEIYQLLIQYKVDKYVNFDLGIIRDFNYYTGMVFEGYTPGLGFPLCGGGRYDTMVDAFGVNCPATGFALGIERILLALERQGKVVPLAVKDLYIGWNTSSLAQAIAKANQLRREGRTVELGLASETREQAQAMQLAKGYNELCYMG